MVYIKPTYSKPSITDSQTWSCFSSVMSLSVIKLETRKNTRRLNRPNYMCCDWPKKEFTIVFWLVVLETGNEELQKNKKYYV